MPATLTSFGAFKQNITGGAFENLSANNGDALSVLNFGPNAAAYVEEIWTGNSGGKSEFALWSSRFGDSTRGLRLQHQFNPTLSGADGEPQLLLPRLVDIPLYSSDTLTAQVNGTATHNANMVVQVYYTDLPGSDQRLATWQEIEGRIDRVLGIEVTVTPGATGDYGTAVALNANDDRLQANSDYAILGINVDQPVLSIGIKGPDTGFYRIGIPGSWDARHTADWFVQQSLWRGSPRIPIVNSNNKAGTFLDGLSSANAGATKVTLIMAQLRPF